ncbi:MAG: PQQ-binding-like beta-propeller repeat protein, partial [Bacteroidales bacterium]|nr:PQQ-binding-like beta-propeller repeat protein [Bacteroidales bacterium]
MKKILALLFLIFPLISKAQSSTCWPSFRGNSAMTGTTNIKLSNSPELLWSFKTGDGIKSSPIYCNKNIFIGSNDGFVYSISSKGKLNWKYKTTASIEAAPLYLNHILYVSSLEGILYSIDALSGKLKWKYATEGQISGSSTWVFSPDKKSKYVLTGSYDYFLHAVDMNTGKAVWKYEADNYINGAPCTNGKVALFGGCDGYLHIVDVQTGKAEKLDIGTYIASSAAISDSLCFFGNYDGDFYCADFANKKIIWKHTGSGPFLASPAVFGNKVIIGSQDKTIYCFNKTDGKVLWKFKTLGKVDGSAIISGD